MAITKNIITQPGPAGSADVTTLHSTTQANGSYFCIPVNDNLLGYWDTVADRLFKVRNCMNIEGVMRQLPLFAPPIDPALLVAATAMGVDLSSAVTQINAATPRYRFTYMIQKALELCGDLKAMGSALLSALEKKDSEALAALRASHETNLLQSVKLVKTQQVEEAQDTIEGLGKSRELADIRSKFYTSRPFMNAAEALHIAMSTDAATAQAIIEGVIEGAASLHVLPTAQVGGAGSFGSPLSFLTVASGTGAAYSIEAHGKAASIVVSLMREAASISATLGGYQRRADDWELQADLAAKEKEQIDQQILAAKVRLVIVQQELTNQDQQIDDASAVEDFLRSKYSSEELYNWTVSEVSKIYFQSYKLAYEIAKRAEMAFQFDRGLSDSNYIRFGYWESRRRGLLAGEQLYLDLKRMEMEYLDQNKREYEITKHISLVLSAPLALIALKETGQCIVELPESLFDVDYPGHYLRRIKSVSLSIPCVVGPYTGINCTLTLLKSSIRLKNSAAGDYARNPDGDDRFRDYFSAVESIATSHAQNDSGMFELNFRDERYLPFEGAGAISTWLFEMPNDTNTADLENITDVIMNLNYTARDGGKPLQTAARDAWGQPKLLTDQAYHATARASNAADSLRLFSLRHEFPSEWYRFLHPADTASSQTMNLALTGERFPFQYRGSLLISQIDFYLKFKLLSDQVIYFSGSTLNLHLTAPVISNVSTGSFVRGGDAIGGLPFASVGPLSPDLGQWLLEFTDSDVQSIDPALQTTVQAPNVLITA
jgi:hypothetical protein